MGEGTAPSSLGSQQDYIQGPLPWVGGRVGWEPKPTSEQGGTPHTQDSLLDRTLLGLGHGLLSPGLVASPHSGCLTKLPLEAPTHCLVHPPVASRPCCAVPALHWSLAHGAGWHRNLVLLTSIRRNVSVTTPDPRLGVSISAEAPGPLGSPGSL